MSTPVKSPKLMPTKRQQEAMTTYLQTGNYKETGEILGIRKQTANELVHTGLERIDLDAFQEEQNRIFIVKTWRIVGKCEDLLERKIDMLIDDEKLDKEDATKLSRVIYDLRRSMQGAINFIQINMQRNAEATGTPLDLEAEALECLSAKYGKSRESIVEYLKA